MVLDTLAQLRLYNNALSGAVQQTQSKQTEPPVSLAAGKMKQEFEQFLNLLVSKPQ